MATLGYEYSFTPSTAAKATEVNANFNAVKVFVDGLSTGANIDGSAITESKINNGAVTEVKIANSAVTTDKINNNAVTTAKIANGTVLASDLDYTTPVASGGNREIFLVSTYNASLGKIGDIQIVI